VAGEAGGEAMRAIEEEVRRRVAVLSWRGLLSLGDRAASYGRRSSLWPMQFGLACCAIEMIATAASRFDLARFGSDIFRGSPRQADLMIISGTVTKKMAPVIVRLYDQMAEPKYVMSMGACANGGGPFKEGYNVVSGIDEFLPVDVYVRGCPPTPQALLHGLMELQKRIDGESFIKAWHLRKRPEVPPPVAGPDLVDLRQLPEIRDGLSRSLPQRLKAPKEAPSLRPPAAVTESATGGAVVTARDQRAHEVLASFGAKPAGGAFLVPAARWTEAAVALRDTQGYDYLANLTAADYEGSIEAVYHLYRTKDAGPALAVKVRADRNDPEVPSVTPVWPGAALQEREVFDMFGMRFRGHPGLKRILTWDGFSGWPLRKDFMEPYYDEPRKPYSTRWREGHWVAAEERNRWRRNVLYPADWDPDSLPPSRPCAPECDTELEDDRRLLVSLGPQHPSTHGVFQMRVLLEGERIVDLEPVFGYLHRSHEKLGERNAWLMNMPYTDRLDYFCSMSNNLAYATAVEKLCGMKVPERAEYIRVMMAELTRILNHFMSVGFLLNELGAMFTPMLYALEEREIILDLFEMASGSRMMCNYMRFSGVSADLPAEFMPLFSRLVTERLPRAIEHMDGFLTRSDLVMDRMRGIGVLTPEKAVAWSASGPVLRASGVKYDVRRAEPYSIYDRFEFEVPTYPNGDAYDRYRIRIAEMWQSLRILEQVLKGFPGPGPVVERNQYSIRPPEGEVYHRCENPKGELGFYLVSDGSANPYRYHVRAPSFVNLTALSEMCRGHLLADAVAVLGSLDVMMGEVDR